MTPVFNWRELEIFTNSIRKVVTGLFVDRIIIPERPFWPGRFIRGEWVVRMTGDRRGAEILISIRPRHPYLAVSEKVKHRAAVEGTRSPFGLTLSKCLKGSKLLGVETLPKERIVVFWFNSGDSKQCRGRIGLVLTLIPATPFAHLVREEPLQERWRILARSKASRGKAGEDGFFAPPQGAQAPDGLEVRTELVEDPERHFKRIENELEAEAYDTRIRTAEKALRDLFKQAQDRIRQSETSLKEAQAEPDYSLFGDLMKSSLGDPPPLLQEKASRGTVHFREVLHYGTDEKVQIPCDPKLSAQEQVEKFFQASRRKSRRIQEARNRIEETRNRVSELKSKADKLLELMGQTTDSFAWKTLEEFERLTGIEGVHSQEASVRSRRNQAWLGKTFISRDGLTIWVGRRREENLELTFKHARGNDLWLHVRGRPGAHAVIPLQPGKSAPLETLLDAATLAIYYSGGENWGKTEVDYTYKKYVKRIKDSAEASYTHNKTLLVEPDPARIQRLLATS